MNARLDTVPPAHYLFLRRAICAARGAVSCPTIILQCDATLALLRAAAREPNIYQQAELYRDAFRLHRHLSAMLRDYYTA